jgi:DNA-binding NarL/FixJ family response regulator
MGMSATRSRAENPVVTAAGELHAVVADEWAVLRSGVTVVLGECNVKVSGRVSTASEAIAAVTHAEADLLVLGLVSDIPLLAAVGRARKARSGLRIVVLVPSPDRTQVLALLDAGCDAVLTRTASEDELRDATFRVIRGERFIAPGLLATLFGEQPSVEAPVAHPLTERERRVLGLLVEGRSNREIARALFIGEATVKTHLHNLYEKLEVGNRVQAVGRAIEMRLLY